MAKQKYSFDSKIHIYRATKRMSNRNSLTLLEYLGKQLYSLKETDIIRPCCWHIALRKYLM